MFKNFLEHAGQIAQNLLSNPIIQKQIPAVAMIDKLVQNNNITAENGMIEKIENLVLVARKNPKIRSVVNHFVNSNIQQFIADPTIFQPENQHQRQQTAFNYGYGFQGFTDIDDRTQSYGQSKNLDNSKPQQQTNLSVSDGKDMTSNQTGVIQQVSEQTKVGVDLGHHVQIQNEVIDQLKQKLIQLSKNGSQQVREKAKLIMANIQESAIKAKIAIQNLQKPDYIAFNDDNDAKQDLGMVDGHVEEFEKGHAQVRTFSDLVTSKPYIIWVQQKYQEKQLTQDQVQLAQETLFNPAHLMENVAEYPKPKSPAQQQQLVTAIASDMENGAISGIIIELTDLNGTNYSIAEVLYIVNEILSDIAQLEGNIDDQENVKEVIDQQKVRPKRQKKEANTFQISQSSAYRVRPLN